jgi:hypothetical protein
VFFFCPFASKFGAQHNQGFPHHVLIFQEVYARQNQT